MRTPRVLARLDRLLGLLAELLAWIGAAAIVALMGITVVAVFWRYVLNDPIFGIEDLSIISLTLVAGAAVAYGGRRGAHVSVDVISYVADRRTKRYTDAAMRVAAIGILGLATWALYAKACGPEKACITSNFSISHRPFYYYLGVAICVYTLQVAVEFLISLFHFHADDPNEVGT